MIKFSPGRPCCTEQPCRKFNFNNTSFYITLPNLVANTGSIYGACKDNSLSNCNIFYGTYLLNSGDLVRSGPEAEQSFGYIYFPNEPERNNPLNYNPDMSFERYEKSVSYTQNIFNDCTQFISGVYTIGLFAGCSQGTHVFYPFFSSTIYIQTSGLSQSVVGLATGVTIKEWIYGYGTGYKESDIGSLSVYNSPLRISCIGTRQELWGNFDVINGGSYCSPSGNTDKFTIQMV